MLQTVKVKSIKKVPHEKVVHDISVQDNNNFFACTESKFPVLVHNCGLDVVIPFAIHEKQIQKAKDNGYKKYMSVVTEQMSDIIHALSTLEYNGYPVDIEYLFGLKFPDSPINKEIERLLSEFCGTDSVKALNLELLKELGVPSKNLFGKAPFVFKVNKKDHLEKLFFDTLKLKAVAKGKSGKGKIDKAFQTEYKEVNEVKLFADYKKAIKLRDSYVNQMAKFWTESEDFKADRHIRCSFVHLTIVTGRVAAQKPGLQQIPSRSELGKHIKRLFAAPRGTFFVKVDYRAHEVRGWGIISKDSAVAKAFKVGQDLIKKYKLGPTDYLLTHIGLEGDVHKVNSSFFFNKKIEDVNKEDRNGIKSIIFGLIYGMSMTTLAKTLNMELEDTEKLVAKFMKQFVNGGAWFDKVHTFARKYCFVESPIGRRRNLYGYLFGQKDKRTYEKVIARYERQATNSVIQGFGSDCMMIGIRKFCTNVWEFSQQVGYYPHIKPSVSVHDSLEVETDYPHIIKTIALIEQSLTHDVKDIIKQRHNFELNSDLEIDFDLGVTTDKLSTWYGDLDELELIVYKSLIYQNEIIRNKKFSTGKQKVELEYSPKEIKRNMEAVFNPDYYTSWMLKQAEEHKPRFLDYSFNEKLILDRLGDKHD